MSKAAVEVLAFQAHAAMRERVDDVAVEEPLQIRVRTAGKRHDVAVTMRTPGADFELAAGFLFSEGLVCERNDITAINYCNDEDVSAAQKRNIVTVELRAGISWQERFERHFTIGSSCGVCGTAQLEALSARGISPIAVDSKLENRVLLQLPNTLRERQRTFASTGGLHASALFTFDGELLSMREDIGRHNATDKVIGWGLLEGRFPLSEAVLLVSGRASFEIVQKAAVAGIPLVAAISAPSSLAVATAAQFGVTLVAFLRDERFNVYSHPQRIVSSNGGR